MVSSEEYRHCSHLIFGQYLKIIHSHFPGLRNNVKAWHRRWDTLVGKVHPGLIHIINEIKKEQNTNEIEIEKIRIEGK